ncbi:hypothetical protein SCOCK_10170 [Actinacidiphila cocklensis]|uniref:Uncharacterized protein n=1 Tax=Actinacidiphila cocklensis TaxID=887465 RepID=A0A9W4GNM4_9ACTN|nr:hypothetical protein SCOCK_10170 [Actinacidiphila cocklensis]
MSDVPLPGGRRGRRSVVFPGPRPGDVRAGRPRARMVSRGGDALSGGVGRHQTAPADKPCASVT